MPFTNDGKTYVMEKMISGARLAFGTIDESGAWSELDNTSGAGNETYKRMRIYIYNDLGRDDDKRKNPTKYDDVLFVSITDGVVTNLYDAYFNDADDGVTPDSLDALNTGGWKDSINAIAIYKGDSDVWYYASKFTENPIYVYNGHRIKLPKGKFVITFNPIENGTPSVQASAQSETVSLNMESKVNLEVEG